MRKTADDFGLSQQINHAICYLVELNQVNHVSVLVNGPELPLDSIEQLLTYRSEAKVQIGLHFDLLEFNPISKEVAGSLSRFEKKWNLIWPRLGRIGRFVFYALKPLSTQQEIAAQVGHFEKLFRQTPDYFDSHFHVHQWPFIFSNFLITLQKQNFKKELFVRNSSYPFKRIASKVFQYPWFLTLKVTVLACVGQFRKRILQSKGVKTNEVFLGVNPFSTQISYESVFSYYEKDLGSDGIWMIHPAGEQESGDKIGIFRLEEYVFFKNRGLAERQARKPCY